MVRTHILCFLPVLSISCVFIAFLKSIGLLMERNKVAMIKNSRQLPVGIQSFEKLIDNHN